MGRAPVHVIDREADSVGHYRRWHVAGHRFVVRADRERVVLHEGRECKLGAVAVGLAGGFTDVRDADGRPEVVTIRAGTGRVRVAEAAVVLHRPARHCTGELTAGGNKVKVEVPGPPLPLRLVVAQVRDGSGAVLAQWLLLTNVPAAVEAARVALWYYWRWRIETYFKLLKGAGLHLEQWQQETARATAKRLAVASMACVLVWRVARSERPEGPALRDLLVRLSGRQVRRGDGFTEPALLAGLYVLLSTLEVLEHYDPRELRRLLDAVLEPAPEPPRRRVSSAPDSG